MLTVYIAAEHQAAAAAMEAEHVAQAEAEQLAHQEGTFPSKQPFALMLMSFCSGQADGGGACSEGRG
jgi:hypothetical protein